MKRLGSGAIRGLARVVNAVLQFLIAIIQTMVNIMKSIGQFLFTIFAFGGCLFMILTPYLLFAFPILLILFIFPILGSSFVHLLEYGNYIAVEYLNQYADFLDGKYPQYKTFHDFREEYKRKQERAREEEERRRREEQARAEQEMWESFFNQTFGGFGTYQNSDQNGYSYDQYRQYQQNYQQNHGFGSQSFTEQYKKACQTLGVSDQADKYEIKLAYRKLAKKYHPDLNKAPDAKEKFQEINAAHDFLTDEAIERYKKQS